MRVSSALRSENVAICMSAPSKKDQFSRTLNRRIFRFWCCRGATCSNHCCLTGLLFVKSSLGHPAIARTNMCGYFIACWLVPSRAVHIGTMARARGRIRPLPSLVSSAKCVSMRSPQFDAALLGLAQLAGVQALLQTDSGADEFGRGTRSRQRRALVETRKVRVGGGRGEAWGPWGLFETRYLILGVASGFLLPPTHLK